MTGQPAVADGPPAFDLTGPLPTGTTVLEASAGTGKTYAIAALAARFIAEGRAELDDLLLVTFGRLATNELRDRVRERLAVLERCLGDAVGGIERRPSTGDTVADLLCATEPAELRRRHERLVRALADFDRATIATTHEFCQRMLTGLGILGDRDPGSVFLERLTDLTHEVAADLYVQRYAIAGRGPFTYTDALALATTVVDTPHAGLVPVIAAPDSDPPSVAAERVSFAAAVRTEVIARKRARRVLTYDDLLTRLRDVLADPAHGPAAAARLRDRYRVVMVDEFQDTDPIQWEILRRAFLGHGTLVLIGDPKQAIYAFRGADVYSYLDAVGTAGQVATLATNWRSDQALVDALHELFGGTALGDERIVVRPVSADHRQRRLHAPATRPALASPVRLRVHRHEDGATRTPSVAQVRKAIAADLVADITDLLASDTTVSVDARTRPVTPRDIAVLVRRNETGERLREDLVAAGVPAVMVGATSVFASPAAADWLTLLAALEQPQPARIRRAALTCFYGWTFPELVAAGDDEHTLLAQRVRWWSRVLASRGVAALLETITADVGLPERLLRHQGGERLLTDVRHLAQVLHQAMTRERLGPGALLSWLDVRVTDARREATNEGTRRLETEAEAVTIMTVHKSKGLEFAILYLPEAWDRHVPEDKGEVLRLHERRPDGTIGGGVLDVGGRGPGRAERFGQSRVEEAGEDLRLCYVALTRAQVQVVTWWAPSWNTPASALQRLLEARASGSVAAAFVEPAFRYELDGDPLARPGLVAELTAAGWSVEEMTARAPAPRPATGRADGALRARELRRGLDLDWQRTSYTGLTAAAHGLEVAAVGVGSEPEPVRDDDETDQITAEPAAWSSLALDAGDPSFDRPSPMRDLPSGADFGTVVHAVFETIDPQAADLAAALRDAVGTALARTEPGRFDAGSLAAALLPAFATPLGPLANDLRLSDIGARDRLPELPFEYPLAGGDRPRAELRLGAMADTLRAHLGADDPFAAYPDRLAAPVLSQQPLRGYLNGSIDAVLRIRDAAGPRYLVVDYKTNWLGDPEHVDLRLADYRPERMAEAMMVAHYPLQALLYSVALHRFLRWRQPAYDPDRHLGGTLYLFVRGMAGPDTPRVDGVPCGVASWRPPADLIVALSDLLHGDNPGAVPA